MNRDSLEGCLNIIDPKNAAVTVCRSFDTLVFCHRVLS